ncbi:MAG: class I SAM-dependent methyltransferase [Rubrivivax sp.]|nr:class I SAM-dependent methyltransferase [Pyrinomonadaceae bacterium]
MAEEIEDDARYFKATRQDFLRTLQDPSRVRHLIDIIHSEVGCVLDVGCGIGQALFPLAVSKKAIGIGVDISDVGVRMGREFYAEHLPDARVAFVRAKAESLPFEADSFDIVNCGLALPYTDNARALAEIARVLRPGGLFLLKFHHARYYLRELRRGIFSRDLTTIIYAGRVLVAGAIYHLTGRQPSGIRFLNESFQTRWLLSRELAKCGLSIARERPDSNSLTPAFVIYRESMTG